jgi:hypothetical protein
VLHFRIDASGPIKSFDNIARRAGDTAGLLKRWGGYFRSKAHARADAAEGWPGLSAATFFLMWRSEVNDFAKYHAEIVAAGKAQEAEVVRITTEQKQITEDTTNAWKAALDLTRSQYATAGRVRQPSGSCQMPGVSQPGNPGNGAGPCYNQCQQRAMCTDGCPWGASCNYVNAAYPYWRVLSCRR